VTRCVRDEDFEVLAERRSDCRVLVARGALTAIAGEQLCRAIGSACEQDGEHLVADLTAVTTVEPAGWAWLLPALQECQAAGRQLRILPPRVGSSAADRGTPARLRCYPDGPILVRGDFELIDRAGMDIPRTRSVVALCRCGNSAIKPFCDSSHKSTRFSDG
jgi:ABC-type transporter Mla MlaB component